MLQVRAQQGSTPAKKTRLEAGEHTDSTRGRGGENADPAQPRRKRKSPGCAGLARDVLGSSQAANAGNAGSATLPPPRSEAGGTGRPRAVLGPSQAANTTSAGCADAHIAVMFVMTSAVWDSTLSLLWFVLLKCHRTGPGLFSCTAQAADGLCQPGDAHRPGDWHIWRPGARLVRSTLRTFLMATSRLTCTCVALPYSCACFTKQAGHTQLPPPASRTCRPVALLLQSVACRIGWAQLVSNWFTQ